METKQPSANQNLTGAEAQQQVGSNNRVFMVTAISILLTAMVVGSTVYFWQNSANEKKIISLEQKISSLEKQISAVKREGVIPQPTSSPELIPMPATDSTSDWKTYQNEKVTFKFPPQWTQRPILIHGSGFTQEFKDPEGKFSLTFLSNGNYNQITGEPYTTIDEYINMPYKVKVVTIDGQEGRQPLPRAGSENVNAVMFFSKDSNFIYTLELKSGNTSFDTPETDVIEGQELFDQILSTFRFTN